jgi:YHS domain-containing protein
MTRVEIRNLARKGLGETTAAFWTDLELNGWVDDACDDLAFRAKCIKANGKMTTVSGTAEYTLLTAYPTLLAVLETYYYINGTTWDKLDPTSRDKLNSEESGWKSVAAGIPDKYYWSKEENLIGFYPKPNATNAGTNYVEVYYARTHTDITDDAADPDIPLALHPAIADFVIARGNETRGWGDKANDRWQKYFTKIHDYQVERDREREDDDIIMKSIYNMR